MTGSQLPPNSIWCERFEGKRVKLSFANTEYVVTVSELVEQDGDEKAGDLLGEDDDDDYEPMFEIGNGGDAP